MRWIVAGHALELVRDSGGVTAAVVGRYFNAPTTFVIAGAAATGVPSGWKSTVAARFTSYADLQRDFAAGTVERTAGAILYDNEAWPLTPVEEQRDPGRFERLAADLTHSHGLIFISAPAVDLARVLAPGAGSYYSTYLSLGIAGQAARSADVIDIQAQGTELDEAAYRSFVEAAAAQARHANPRVQVLAGLSTNPSAGVADPAQLVREVESTRAAVDGYWLNVPGNSECPACGPARPDIAAAFLTQLSSALR